MWLQRFYFCLQFTLLRCLDLLDLFNSSLPAKERSSGGCSCAQAWLAVDCRNRLRAVRTFCFFSFLFPFLCKKTSNSTYLIIVLLFNSKTPPRKGRIGSPSAPLVQLARREPNSAVCPPRSFIPSKSHLVHFHFSF